MKRSSAGQKRANSKKHPTTPLPAKITPPHLGTCYLRKNIFKKLDQYRHKPAVWISGPAGSGKTMLTASYLKDRKISYLWYQVDARDVDPATLFYYLGLAAQHRSPRRRKSLPMLTPEYLGGISAFAHNFFEALFQGLKPPFALVLDNYQEVAEEALLHQVVRDLLAEIPEGGQVMVISRSQPPQDLGRFQVHQQMALLDWHNLQLSVDEVQDLSGVIQKKPLTPSEAATVHDATMGWAAGVVLMLAQQRTDTRPIDEKALSAPEAVFDYFAAVIFSKLDSAIQDFLIKSASLPLVSTSMAEALTGHKQAGRILADLARKNYFTLQHRSHPQRLYQYHPLFKTFLQQKARILLPADQLKALQHSAAALLISAGQYDEAAELLWSAESWDQLAELITTQAKELTGQGRLGTLQKWLEALPRKMFAQQPWLSYWLGICCLPFAPDQSQHHLESAFTGFKSAKDVAGIYLSWSGIIKAIIFHQTDFRPVDNWIEELESVKEQCGKEPTEEIEAQLLMSVFSHFTSRVVLHKACHTWAQRADILWHQLSDKNMRLELGSFLLEYNCFTGNHTQNALIVNELNQLAESDEVHPYTVLLSSMKIVFYYWHGGLNRQAVECGYKALEIAKASGIHLFNSTIWARMVNALLCMGDMKTAYTFLNEMQQGLTSKSQNSDIAYYYYALAWHNLLQGKIDNSIENFKTVAEFGHRLGAVIQTFYCHLGLAASLSAKGDLDEARHTLNESYATIAPLKLVWLDFHFFLFQAYFDLKSHRNDTGLDYLNRGLTLGRKHKFSQFHFGQPNVMGFLFTIALEHDIEADYVRAMVRRFNIRPSKAPLQIARWPWPVKIFTLGRFELQVDDHALTPKRSGQNKPLALLKAIVAFGGRQVSEAHLCEALWPDSAGDAAHVAFTTTLHRLRKMIRHENAITLQSHRVSLDPRHCWVDTWSLEALFAQASDTDLSTEDESADLPSTAEQLFNLYQGYFLTGDEYPWLLGTRENLHSKVLHQIINIASQCLAEKRWRQSIAIYERGLAIDSLAEPFYQGLMQCYQHMGRKADALAVYERCRKILDGVLQVRPCSDIETIRKDLCN